MFLIDAQLQSGILLHVGNAGATQSKTNALTYFHLENVSKDPQKQCCWDILYAKTMFANLLLRFCPSCLLPHHTNTTIGSPSSKHPWEHKPKIGKNKMVVGVKPRIMDTSGFEPETVHSFKYLSSGAT